MTPEKKTYILSKISKLIILYSKKRNVNNYICKKNFKKKGIQYSIFLLDEKKLFNHSKVFKSEKRKFIDHRGKPKTEYYSKFEEWLSDTHPIYIICRNIATSLISEGYYDKLDLIQLNKIYRSLKNER